MRALSSIVLCGAAAIVASSGIGCVGEITDAQPSTVEARRRPPCSRKKPPSWCPDAGTPTPSDPDASPPLSVPDAAPTPTVPDASPPPPPDGGAVTVRVRLVPQAGVSGTQRINVAVPLPPGLLYAAGQVRVVHGGGELPAARRGLASHPDGSVRSVQLQFDLSLSSEQLVDVVLNQTPATGTVAMASVASTLVATDGSAGPRVWAVLDADWLSASGVAGPQVPEAAVAGTVFQAWSDLCDYERWDTDAFLAQSGTAGSWLYDRATVMYRGYARRGDLATLRDAYREAAIYRNGLSGTGSDTRIGVPGASGDLKYHYVQGMALHYLLTGDDRFRDSAEDVATRVASLWSSPGYAGGADFWTERHAGFGLLAYVWAGIVSDDRAAELWALADDAVDAYLAVQATYPAGYSDANARCFAHDADAHGESYGYFGCSPWMSAILADALDAYATERGGTAATGARTGIVKLGRILARDGRDGSGKPYYWMGVGTSSDEVDDYDEHWGETAYVIGMAWHHGGRTDDALRSAALSVAAGLDAHGVVGQLRSFNWQCRSAVATAWYLR